MTPNPYRAWLLGIALSLMPVGSLIWMMGIYSRFLQGPLGLGQDVVGISEITWGSGLVLVGALFLALWLVVSAVLHGLLPQHDELPGARAREDARTAGLKLDVEPDRSL